MSTCPSGVNYMHLIDHGRAYVENRYRRPPLQRAARRLLAELLTRPRLVRTAVTAARPLARMAGILPAFLRPALDLARSVPASNPALPRNASAAGIRRGRVALLPGCVQQVLANEINLASMRLLNRLGFDVSVLEESTCCGAIEHHLGWNARAQARARRNLAAWSARHAREPFDHILVNASGCGTMVKDYGYLLRADPQWSQAAADSAAASRDVTEFLAGQLEGAPLPVQPRDLLVACQVPCSMQHGQQPALARELGRRKASALRNCKADVIATGNLGCALQLRNFLDVPIVHTVQLLDWASGGPQPEELRDARVREDSGT
jgi:glycolate oxidase iron-sulfur subunit